MNEQANGWMDGLARHAQAEHPNCIEPTLTDDAAQQIAMNRVSLQHNPLGELPEVTAAAITAHDAARRTEMRSKKVMLGGLVLASAGIGGCAVSQNDVATGANAFGSILGSSVAAAARASRRSRSEAASMDAMLNAAGAVPPQEGKHDYLVTANGTRYSRQRTGGWVATLPESNTSKTQER